MVMDHFYQLPLLGPPDHEMFEAYTLLGALAARTKTVKLGTLVTGVTYRNPAILAKIVTTLDVVSSGRAFLGIGAAWFDVEHEALGVPFPPVKERFERLEEALHICRAMFRGERPDDRGQHYSVKDAINSPAPVTPGGPPIMIGGQGEKKTLRLMAEHAEMANFTSGFDELPASSRCWPATARTWAATSPTINKTSLCTVVIGRTMELPWRGGRPAQRLPPARGLDWDTLDDATASLVAARLVVGDADTAGERMQELIGLGLDGLTFNMPANGHDPEAVAHTVGVVKAAIG